MISVGSVGFLIGSISIYKTILTYIAIYSISVIKKDARNDYKSLAIPYSIAILISLPHIVSTLDLFLG